MITIFLEPLWQTNQATRTGGYNNRRETKKLSGCSFFSFQANQKKSQISPPPLLCPKSQKPKKQALFSSLPFLKIFPSHENDGPPPSRQLPSPFYSSKMAPFCTQGLALHLWSFSVCDNLCKWSKLDMMETCGTGAARGRKKRKRKASRHDLRVTFAVYEGPGL